MKSLLVLLMLALSGPVMAAPVDVNKVNNAFDLLIQKLILGDELIEAFQLKFNAQTTDFAVPKFEFNVGARAHKTPWLQTRPSSMSGHAFFDLGNTVATGEITFIVGGETQTDQLAFVRYVGQKGLDRIQSGQATAREKEYADIYERLSTLQSIERLKPILLNAASVTADKWSQRVGQIDQEIAKEKAKPNPNPTYVKTLEYEKASLNRSIDAMFEVKVDTVRDGSGNFQKLVISHPHPADLFAFTGLDVRSIEKLNLEIGNEVATFETKVTVLDQKRIFAPHIMSVVNRLEAFQDGDLDATQMMQEEAQKTLTLVKKLMYGNWTLEDIGR